MATTPEDAASSPPCGVTLERYAAIMAGLVEARSPRSAVISSHGLTQEEFDAVAAYFDRVIAASAMEGDGALAEQWAEALAAAHQALAAPPPMTIEAWAELAVDVAVDGMAALATRGLREGDYLRLARHFTAVLARDRSAAHAYAAAFALRARSRAPAAPR